MNISRKRILPKVWLSAIAIGVLFLGFAGATVKASDNQTGGFFNTVAGYLYGAVTGTALVNDVISFNPSNYSVGEGAGQLVNVTVRRTIAPGTPNGGGTTTVQYQTANGTATGGANCGVAGVDYITQGGPLIFGPDVVQQQFNITICQDALVEGSELFNITLFNPDNGATIGQADATVTILDDDAASAGTFAFEAGSQTPIVQENTATGSVTLNVRRTGGTAGTVQVSFTVANGTAVGGTACSTGGAVDFIFPTPNPGTLTFVAGDDLEQITIQVCDDGVLEGDETFTVTLNSATNGGTIADSPAVTNNNRATVTIRDGDALNPGTIQFPQANFNANEGVGSGGGANTAFNDIRIPVQRFVAANQTPTGAVQVNFTVTNGSATGGTACGGANVDYVFPSPNPGILTFPNGTGERVQTQFITIRICNNDINAAAEMTETFNIALNNPTGGATLAFQSATVVSIVDDRTGTIQFSPTSYTVTEGSQDPATPTPLQITVTRNPGEGNVVSQETVSVQYVFTNGAANAAGTAAVGGASCTAGIDYINTPGTPAQNGILTFQGNVTTQFLNVSICPDSIFESSNASGRNEFFTVTLTAAANAAIVFPELVQNSSTAPTVGTVAPNAAQALVTIIDDDTANAGVISITDPNTGAAATTLTFGEVNGVNPGGTAGAGNRILIVATRNNSQEAATVTATINSGTAVGGTACTAGVDFVFPTGATVSGNSATVTLSFPSGGTTGTVGQGNTNAFPANSAANSITICNDTVFENTESFTITLSGATSASGTAQVNPNFTTLTVNILDNDAQPGTLSVVGPSGVGVTAAGNVNESGGTGAPFFTTSIRVTRAGTGSNGSVSVTLTLANGSAVGDPGGCGGTVNGDFFNPGPQTVTLADGVEFVDVPVTICNNDQNDGNANEALQETFTATITNVSGGAVIGVTSQVTITIQDDRQGTFQVGGPTPTTISEGVGVQQITVTRVGANPDVTISNPGNTAVNVTFTFGGTAVGATGDCTPGNGVDYLVPTGNNTLSFGPGVVTATFNITVCDDTLIEGPETITVNLAGTTPGSPSELLGSPNPFTITIADNETPQTFALSSPSVNEGNAGQANQLVFTVTPNLASSTATTATFAITGNGANVVGGATCTGNVDFINTGGTVTFAANSAASQTIVVPICGDTINEPNETITVTLSGTGVPAGTTGTGTIVNDDAANGSVTVADIRVVEDGTVPGSNAANPAPGTSNLTVTIALANPTVNAATVQFATANGTAVGGAACGAGVDFVNSPGTANFAANATSATFTVTVCNDTVKEANETFFVNLSNGTNANITDAQAIVIIVDNDRNVRADVDRDRRTDATLFRPSNNFFYILQTINGIFRQEQFGPLPANAGDVPVPGDYDNDGATDLAFFRPSNATYYIQRSIDNAVVTVPFGLATDIQAQGDYNGDGATELAVFRPSTGTFFIANSLTNASTNFTSVAFGANGDIPVPADFDGDFRTDVAVFRPSTGTFFVRRSTGGDIGFQFGQSGDRPITGDFDGDGRADFTVFRPSGTPNVTGGVFFTFQSLTNTVAGVAFGAATDIPAVGDYDGDGTDDVAFFRPTPSAGFGPSFFFLRSATGSSVTLLSNGATRFGNANFDRIEFGIAGDIPLPSRYQPMMP